MATPGAKTASSKIVTETAVIRVENPKKPQSETKIDFPLDREPQNLEEALSRVNTLAKNLRNRGRVVPFFSYLLQLGNELNFHAANDTALGYIKNDAENLMLK